MPFILSFTLALHTGVSALAGQDAAPLKPYAEKISRSLISFEMMPVPGGRVQITVPAGRTIDVPPFWMSTTEVTWDMLDVFVFGLDGADTTRGADAVSRPSKPYVLAGEQFGHAGHPALGMTFDAAVAFAQWLSAKTGRKYRLPTEAEWEHACRLGGGEPSRLDQRAWFAGNSGERTHRVGSLPPDQIGMHDVLGNAAEWVMGADSIPVIKGGAFNDAPAGVTCVTRRPQTSAWNATDPQLPKSRWWLPDAPFVGFRLVSEPQQRAPR